MSRPIILCLLAPLLLAACVLSPVEPEVFATYRLELDPLSTRGEDMAWQLSIEEPIAPGPIAGTHIAVRDTDRAYSVLRGARWSERAPDLLQSALVRSFEDSGRIRGVARAMSGVRADYQLLTEVRAFEADYTEGSSPVIKIALYAKVVRTAGMDVVDARLFTEREAAKGGDVTSIMGAFDRAGGRAIPELRDWVLRTGQADWVANRK
jgi:cholesterol transport system auxiliary component